MTNRERASELKAIQKEMIKLLNKAKRVLAFDRPNVPGRGREAEVLYAVRQRSASYWAAEVTSAIVPESEYVPSAYSMNDAISNLLGRDEFSDEEY